MNLSGMCQMSAFIGYPVFQASHSPGRTSNAVCRAIGFQIPKPPSGFFSRTDLLDDTELLRQSQYREVPHIPDTSPESVISYAGIFKDVDVLPRRTLQDVDIATLGRTGVLAALSNVFSRENIEELSRLQLGLFNELAYGSNVLFHSATSTGKTFAMLLYAVMRYYYNVPPDLLCERKVTRLIHMLEDVNRNIGSYFEPISSKVPQRVMVLCPTKELAIQNAKQIISFAGGDEKCVRLIIDDQALLPNDIGPKQTFIVGSANQLNVYLQAKEKTYLRDIMQHVGMIILDEVDRLLKVTNQYASERKKEIYKKHQTSSFQICQALLALSPNKLQLVGASASISRNHIRFFDNLIQSYRTVKCPLAIIRNKDEKTASNRYVAVPSAVSHQYALADKDSLPSKVARLVDILKSANKERTMFFISSKHSLLSFKHYMEKHGMECKVLHHEFGIRDNVSKRFSGEMVKGLYDRRESTEALKRFEDLRQVVDVSDDCMYAASMDSARGLHFPTLDVVYMIGVPRNANEYVHISGRVGRCDRPGRCIVIDTVLNIKKSLAWQNGIDCKITPLTEKDSQILAAFKPYGQKKDVGDK